MTTHRARPYLKHFQQDRPRRNFDPAMSRRYGWGKLNPDELVKYSPKWKYSRLFYLPSSGGRSRPSMRTIVISVDGGSRGNNRNNPNSLAAYGVYFGPNCPRNTRGLLDPDDPQTSSRAELEAVHKALLYVQGMTMFGELDGWHEVILKLDSEYVAKSFSEWIWKWEDNNYYSSK